MEIGLADEFVMVQNRGIMLDILRAIVENEGITSKELMKKFNISPGTITREIRALHTRGYIFITGTYEFHYLPTKKALKKFKR